jgi:hypothetical protein
MVIRTAVKFKFNGGDRSGMGYSRSYKVGDDNCLALYFRLLVKLKLV